MFPHTSLLFCCWLQRHSFIARFVLDWTRPGPFCFFIDFLFFWLKLTPLILPFPPTNFFLPQTFETKSSLKQPCCKWPLLALFILFQRKKASIKYLINSCRCWRLCMDYRNAGIMCESSKTPFSGSGAFTQANWEMLRMGNLCLFLYALACHATECRQFKWIYKQIIYFQRKHLLKDPLNKKRGHSWLKYHCGQQIWTFSNSISQENFVKKEIKTKKKKKSANTPRLYCLMSCSRSLCFSGDLRFEYCPFYLLDNSGAGSLGHYHENAEC